MNIPDKEIGVSAYGLKTGIITFDDDIVDVIDKKIGTIFKNNPDIIKDKDILCVTEAVVAISQHNYVKLEDITKEIKHKLNLKEDSTLGIIYPILSRNRFSMILKAISRVVPKGKIIIQLLFPDDEQGNSIISREYQKNINKNFEDKISLEDLADYRLLHPETGVDYIKFYKNIVKKQGPDCEIYLANSTKYMVENNPDGVIVCNVHHSDDTKSNLKNRNYNNLITLKDLFSDKSKKVYSKYGLLGSNILDPEKELLKLAPRDCNNVCRKIQKRIKEKYNRDIEVLIYGDGAYKDPESGIYELADPVSCFGSTPAISSTNRIGVKTKYLMQKLYSQGKTKEEILEKIKKEKQRVISEKKKDDYSSEGTTPRKIKNLASSLADLISGSADSNTPVVIIRGYI
jgi:F420-0:gamma-glutamyl ligase